MYFAYKLVAPGERIDRRMLAFFVVLHAQDTTDRNANERVQPKINELCVVHFSNVNYVFRHSEATDLSYGRK